MKKKVLTVIFICLIVFPVILITGCNRSNGGSAASGETAQANAPVILQYMTGYSGPALEAEKKAFDIVLKKTNPNITVETQSVPGNDTFIAALKAKFAAGEAPDFYRFQSGNRIRELAKEGLLYDMTDEEFLKRANPVDIPFNSYQGRIYGVPTEVGFNGLYINHEVFDKYPNIKIPENFDEFITACEQLRAAGLEYPVIMAGKDIGNVSQIDFQYICTVVVPTYPNYYQELIDGTRKFNDPFIRDMFVKFDKVRNFCSEDSLGVDNDEAIRRFIRGEGALWIAFGGTTITRIREMAGEEFDFRVYPSILQDKDQQRYFNCAQVSAISIVKATEHIDAVREAVTAAISPEACNFMTTEGLIMPALLGVEQLPDKSLEPCREWFNSPYKVFHADLVWVPGIKDVMRDVTQRWYMGEPLDDVLNEWEAQHRRLIDSNPDFVANYGKE